MLTCKVGENLINPIDVEYTDEILRKWSNKHILKCPVCNGVVIYRNGLIKVQHFAHKHAECGMVYFENETKEHMQGKTILYNWLKRQDGLENVKLEYWIPETKQRPDLYFEKEGKRYVVEFQCTPITIKEYRERHELYKLNNIIDIWILGKENYDMSKNENVKICDTTTINMTYRTKALERELINAQGTLYYLDVVYEMVYLIKNNRRGKEVTMFSYDYFILDINMCELNTDVYLFMTQSMEDLELARQEQLVKDRLERERIELIKSRLNDIVPSLFSKLRNEFPKLNFRLKKGSYQKYIWSISIFNNRGYFYFFINHDSLDFCEPYEYKKKGERYQSRGFRKIQSFSYDNACEEEIEKFIRNNAKIFT